NDRVFANKVVSVEVFHQRVLAWLTVVRNAMDKDMIVHHPCPPARTEELISWKPPPPEWVTLNSDGSVHQDSDSAAAGGLIRDHLGYCIAAFACNLGICSITQAELRGAAEGLQLAWDLGFRRVRVELDSRCAVHLLSSNAHPDHQHSAITDRIQALCKRDWEVALYHVYREGNKCVDYLASQGHYLSLGVHSFPASDPTLMYWIFIKSTLTKKMNVFGHSKTNFAANLCEKNMEKLNLSALAFLCIFLSSSPNWITIQAQSLPPAKFDGFLYSSGRVDPDAILIEAFFDPVCPDSRDSWPPLKLALDHYGPRVSLRLHLLPLPYHDNAFVASRALHIANLLNASSTFPLMEQFFKYQEKFYNDQTINLSKASVVKQVVDFATPAVGNFLHSEFETAFNDRRTDLKTRVSFKFSASRGVYGTPAFYINGFALPDIGSPLDYNGWRKIIDPLVSAKFDSRLDLLHTKF
ncbi:unnamed protein product, partial [Linum tenue]